MRKLFPAIVFCLAAFVSKAQVAYVNTPSGIYSLTGGAGSCTYVPLPNECNINSIFSMAVFHDTLFFTSGATLYSFRIGTPGSCHNYGFVSGASAMTVDKNGILYFGSSGLETYNPYTNTHTNLGNFPGFSSGGDLIFFNDKLLLAGSPAGIYEINISNPGASTLYMNTPQFWGLISYPVPCSNSRYFGLTPGGDMVELDLANKTVIGSVCTLSLNVYDGASSTETGIDAGVNITNLVITHPCPPANTGSIQVSCDYAGAGQAEYLLDNTTFNTTGTFANIPVGTHTIKASAPGGGCSTTKTFTIAQGLDPVVNITKTNANDCDGSNGTISLAAVSPHTPIKYTLVNTGLVQTTGTFSGLSSGTYNFHIADTIGCSKDTTVTIGFDQPDLVNKVDVTDSHCGQNNGQLVATLNVDPVGATSSINNGPYTATLAYPNLAAGPYRLQVKKGASCYFDSIINIQEIADPKPVIQLQVTNQHCFDDNGKIVINVIGPNGPFKYQLDGGSYTSSSSFTSLGPGYHAIKIKNTNGCSWDSFATVAAYPKLPVSINIIKKDPTCRGITDGNLRIDITGFENPYLVSLNGKQYANGQFLTGLTEAEYKFYVINKDGCVVDSGKQQLTIAYEPRCNEVYIPNVFSPNGDGRNDLFRPWSSFFIKDLGMVVYNRYGQVLYKGEGNNMGWNGMYKGVAQDPAAYVYLVVYTDHFGVRQTKKGNVILLR